MQKCKVDTMRYPSNICVSSGHRCSLWMLLHERPVIILVKIMSMMFRYHPTTRRLLHSFFGKVVRKLVPLPVDVDNKYSQNMI